MELWPIGISQSVVIVPVMKPNIIVAVNHDAESIGLEILIVLHPPMSRQVIPEADDHTFAKFTLKDRCPSGCLPVAQLVLAAFGPAALATLAIAPPVKLVQDVLAVSHKACRLPHRLAVLCFLAKLALVGSDPRNSLMLQYFKTTWLVL